MKPEYLKAIESIDADRKRWMKTELMVDCQITSDMAETLIDEYFGKDKKAPTFWIAKSRLDRILSGEIGWPHVYTTDQSKHFECVPLFISADTPAPAPHVTGDSLRILQELITAAEADMQSDADAGERVDLFDYEVELPLTAAKEIVAALSAPPSPHVHLSCPERSRAVPENQHRMSDNAQTPSPQMTVTPDMVCAGMAALRGKPAWALCQEADIRTVLEAAFGHPATSPQMRGIKPQSMGKTDALLRVSALTDTQLFEALASHYLQGSLPLAEAIAERVRQIETEGWTPEHDDSHEHGEMARAAAAYCLGQDELTGRVQDGKRFLPWRSMIWPWAREWWKPKTRREDLIRAAALIIAEIERLDRTTEGQPNG